MLIWIFIYFDEDEIATGLVAFLTNCVELSGYLFDIFDIERNKIATPKIKIFTIIFMNKLNEIKKMPKDDEKVLALY